MNSFAIIFGHCVWVPPSPKAALLALGLFFGVGVTGEADVVADQTAIVDQYVSAGMTRFDAEHEMAALNACFASYEAPPQNRHPADAGSNAWQHERDFAGQ